MEEIKNKKKVHQGNNVRLGRAWKNMTQETLAEKLQMYQKDVSALEYKETIDDEILNRIAEAMDIPVDFFKEFQPEAAIKSFSQNNDINISDEATSTVNSNQADSQQIEQNNNYFPLDKVAEVFAKLFEEKEKQIEDLRKELEEVKSKLL